jgi:hypothetical protein
MNEKTQEVQDKIKITDEEFAMLQTLVNSKREVFSQYGEFVYKAKMRTENIELQLEKLDAQIVEFQKTIFTRYGIASDTEVEITPEKELVIRKVGTAGTQPEEIPKPVDIKTKTKKDSGKIKKVK